MNCVDDVTLLGHDNDFKQTYLRILFESCHESWYDGDGTCKNLDEINDWIKDKHIVVVYNEEQFVDEDYVNPIQKVSRVSRFQLFRDSKVEYPIYVQQSLLALNDSLFSVGVLLQEDKDFFTVNPKSPITSTYIDDQIDQITGSVVFKLDPDRLYIQRIVYNTLDYLGDIGGLFGTFNGFATAFSLILNFNGVYHMLTSNLFRAQTSVAAQAASK